MKQTILTYLLFFSISIIAQPFVYTNNFESGQYFHVDSNSLWERGVPSMSRINTAHSGNNVWVTDLDADYDSLPEYSYLYTQYFDVVAIDSLRLSFWHYMDFYSNSWYDGAYLEYRYDTMTQWANFGTTYSSTGVNWYNLMINGKYAWFWQNSGWVFSSDKYVPNPAWNIDSVQFRFCFLNQQVPNKQHNRNGWAIDDFQIKAYGSVSDVGISKIILPNDTLASSALGTVKVRIINYGFDTIRSIPLKYDMNAAPAGTILCLDTILPGDSTDFTFNSNLFTPFGNFNFCIKTDLNRDFDLSNNEFCKTLFSTMGIDDFEHSSLKIYPNPTSDRIHIEVNSKVNKLTVYTIDGKKLLEQSNHDTENHIILDIEGFESGVYLLLLELEDALIYRKIIIQ